MATLLTKEQILGASDIQTERVSVPEWGGDVLVRGLSGVDRDGFESSMIEGKGKSRDVNMRNLRAKLCALSMVDEGGARLFNDLEAQELGRKSAAALERVFDVARKLSGMSQEDVEELGKPSESPTGGDSPSA